MISRQSSYPQEHSPVPARPPGIITARGISLRSSQPLEKSGQNAGSVAHFSCLVSCPSGWRVFLTLAPCHGIACAFKSCGSCVTCTGEQTWKPSGIHKDISKPLSLKRDIVCVAGIESWECLFHRVGLVPTRHERSRRHSASMSHVPKTLKYSARS